MLAKVQQTLQSHSQQGQNRMTKIDDISLKRQLLTSFRMRFAPEVQQTRENLTDSFIQQVLFMSETGFTVSGIQHNLNTILKVNITGGAIFESVGRLVTNKKVEEYEDILEGVKQKGKKTVLYKLQPPARKIIEKQGTESTNRLNSVCKRLFEDAEKGWEAYVEPFFKFLSSVFYQLAGENYRMIRGELSQSELTASPAFSSALKFVKHDLKSLDLHLFENATEAFFRDPDPDYAAIKWNMAQNYYALRIIGLDKQFLAEEVFTNAKFYLDTNVIISALEPGEPHHKAFLSLCKVCEKIGVEVKVFGITLEELDRFIAHSRDMIANVIEQIPEETACKISSVFFEVYIEKKKSGQPLDLDDVFENFKSPEEKLKDSYNIDKEDDSWFSQVEYEGVISEFAEIVADRYIKMRNRKKYNTAAKHDAMCLLWIEERRQQGTDNIWFVTRDYTLPGCVPPGSGNKSLAITLDALIQWLSPMVVSVLDEDDMALAYSEIITSRILPQERIFDLDDFVIFHELEMTCEALPPEDVEGCIRHIKQNMPLLNPTNAVDREKLARSIAIYFADPSRKYKENVERYESEISKLTDKIEKQTKISAKTDALLKITHIAIGFVLLELIVCIAAANLGSGANVFQRIVNSWPFIIIPFAICVVIGWFYLGKQRIKALGWAMAKLFKNE